MATKASWHNQDTAGTSGWVPHFVVVFQTPSASEEYRLLLVLGQCTHRPGYEDVHIYWLAEEILEKNNFN